VGRDRRGDELPTWVADKQARLDKIRQAKAALCQGSSTLPQLWSSKIPHLG
jgi:hypothetical protein